MSESTTPASVQAFYDQVTNVSDFIWGGTWNGEAVLAFPPMVLVLLGVGAWIMIGLRFYPILKLGEAFAGLFSKEKSGKGEISPFAALSTACRARSAPATWPGWRLPSPSAARGPCSGCG